MLPGFLELDPINDGDDVYSIGWETHLENDAWSGKILKSQIEERCAEFIESIPNFLGVIRIRFDPDIEIFGESGCTVNRKSITADDEKFSVRGVQRGK
ncbi:hypothetical protein GETHLI_35890 [Geothrix limicola]|uniref:Uncharacterized protein n=1 Tax=Geothrix limicola TaxID=2927978 RepID=A0ABQ5QLL8_9BACT|nr:hypothetical protein GETHLI_35890 [Geothrix limicola]